MTLRGEKILVQTVSGLITHMSGAGVESAGWPRTVGHSIPAAGHMASSQQMFTLSLSHHPHFPVWNLTVRTESLMLSEAMGSNRFTLGLILETVAKFTDLGVRHLGLDWLLPCLVTLGIWKLVLREVL